MRIAVLPSYEGKGIGDLGQKGFLEQLIIKNDDLMIIPVFNGANRDYLNDLVDGFNRKMCQQYPARDGIYPACSAVACAPGLTTATIVGYSHALNYLIKVSPEDISCVLKLDPDGEHNPAYIHELADLSEKTQGLIVGDLDLEIGKTVIEGSPDWWTHFHIFPALYESATNGEVSISCGHGFLAFPTSRFLEILNRAIFIYVKAEEKIGKKMEWEWDGTTILAAYSLGIPISVVKIKAQKLRERSLEKNIAQFQQTLVIRDIFLELKAKGEI